MRRHLVFVLFVLAAFTAVPVPATAAKGKRCDPRSSRTVDVTRNVRVYKRRGSLYACAVRVGRPVRIGDAFLECQGSSPCGGPVVADIAGTWVAVNFVDGGANAMVERSAFATVIDTRTRKRRVAYSSSAASDAPPHARADILAMQIGPDGRFALVSSFEGGDGEITRQVRVGSGERGGSTLVDEGQGIDHFSLAVAWGTAYWKNAGSFRGVDIPR